MVDPKRVLFLDHAPALGGAEYSLLEVLARLPREHVAPLLLCAPGPVALEAERRGIPYRPLHLPRLRRSLTFPRDLWLGARQVARWVHQHRADIIYANTVRSQVYAALAHLLSGTPLVWHMRDFWLSEARPRHETLDHLGKRGLCAASRRVIANSQAVARHLPYAAKTVVVHNGIEVERFRPGEGRTAFRQAYNIPLDALVIGTVGRLRPWKGQDRFLRAMQPVAARYPHARFLVVGGTPFGVEDAYAQRLRYLARSLALQQRVIFTGHLVDVRPALAAMDIFVHAGEPEPFGRVVVEAMAMTLPVVAFAHGALPEIVVHGETGLLVEPGDEERLARAVVSLLEDESARRAMGRGARERAAQHFHIRLTVERIVDVLSHL